MSKVIAISTEMFHKNGLLQEKKIKSNPVSNSRFMKGGLKGRFDQMWGGMPRDSIMTIRLTIIVNLMVDYRQVVCYRP